MIYNLKDSFLPHIYTSQNVTTYTVEAEKAGDVPQFGPQTNRECSYILTVRLTSTNHTTIELMRAHYNYFYSLQLHSLPASSDNSDRINVPVACKLTSPVKPNVTQTCDKTPDPMTGTVGITTRFSYKYNPLIEEAITGYMLQIHHLLDSGEASEPVISITYDPMLNRLNEVTTILDYYYYYNNYIAARNIR